MLSRNYHHPAYTRGRGRGRFNYNNEYYFSPEEKPLFTDTKEYWCETCDRDFKSSFLLEDHVKQHQKCNIDGCQFVAHPKIITKHIQMQHASGLYKKIAKLTDPDEINKWREERKMKYPTKTNIDKKSAEVKEKIERGEKMALKRDRNKSKPEFQRNKFGKRRHNQAFCQDKSNTKKNLDNKKNHKNRDSKRVKVPIGEIVIETEKIKLKPFAGIQHFVNDNLEDDTDFANNLTCEVTDDEDNLDINEPASINIDKPSVCSALSSLICDYGSSEDENETDLKISKLDRTSELKKKQVENNYLQVVENKTEVINDSNIKQKPGSDDDSGPEEVKLVKTATDEPNHVAEKNKNNKLILAKRKVVIPQRSKPKLPSTLLSKLLAKEIRHERNIILQCVRHVVKNNYFDE